MTVPSSYVTFFFWNFWKKASVISIWKTFLLKCSFDNFPLPFLLFSWPDLCQSAYCLALSCSQPAFLKTELTSASPAPNLHSCFVTISLKGTETLIFFFLFPFWARHWNRPERNSFIRRESKATVHFQTGRRAWAAEERLRRPKGSRASPEAFRWGPVLDSFLSLNLHLWLVAKILPLLSY